MRKKDHSLVYELKMKVVMKWYVKTTDQNTYMQNFQFYLVNILNTNNNKNFRK